MEDPWPPNLLPTSQPMIDSKLFELDRNSMLKELFEFGAGGGIVGNGNISSTEPISPENSENYLISILKEATSCPNTSGVEWRTVLKDVKDFIVTCEGYLKVSRTLKKSLPHGWREGLLRGKKCASRLAFWASIMGM